MAVVSFGFDHHARSLPARMTEQQHAHHESIIASMHVHASHERCVEVVVMRGKYKSISPLAQEMIAETGIENGAVHYVALSSGDHDHHHEHAHTHQHGHETVKD
jgi:CopG family nickel-responsive transcriptional regulator